jgi:DNA-directed RNA polymerase subunit RPC12/RpoP
LGCDRCKSLGTITKGRKQVSCPECGGTGQGEKQFNWPEDERDRKEEAHSHPCSECGTEMNPVDQAHTQYRCPNWKGGCSQADSGVPTQDCERCWKNSEKKREEEESTDKDIEYLQWQIGNLDTALEELDNSASSRLIELEGQHPQKWSLDWQPIPKALMDEQEEGRWSEWADQFKIHMSNWTDAMTLVDRANKWKTGTPEDAIKMLNNSKGMIEDARRWISDTSQLVDTEPVNEDDKILADDLKDMFKDPTTLQAIDILLETLNKVIAEKQTMAIPR